MKHRRGAPGAFGERLQRAQALLDDAVASEPLEFLVAILGHQLARSGAEVVRAAVASVARDAVAARLLGDFPLLELRAALDPIGSEIDALIEGEVCARAPEPLRAAAEPVRGGDRTVIIETWLDDPSLVAPATDAWIRIAAAPIFEGGAARVEPLSKDEWTGSACPVCGDAPQVSVIVEESGAFLQGSPRYLVCRRCATWWPFPRATCPWCGEDDSRRLTPFVESDRPWARIDGCATCRGYVKTLDLRAEGAVAVVPLVDDLATLALDLWAQEKGMTRPTVSLAGV